MKPAFFDIFGIIGFSILLFIGLKLSKRKSKKVKYFARIILIIALIGLVVDLFIVFSTYVF